MWGLAGCAGGTAAQQEELDHDASVAVAGGVESMTRAPYVLPKSDKPFPAGHTELYSTTRRIAATGVSAIDPHYSGLAPVEAVNRALGKAGKTFADLDVLELNEAFAAQVLGCVAEWPEFDPAILNPQGGAIALGHPLGASGARLAGTVAHQLAAKGSGTGVATLSIGVGQGLALVLER
ncbi:3-oxoadipyl-CoA/3-oxo-5,6-dehydrosuberyl-CoA thiolase [Streptomyces jeddahensis]|uniref:acetyl-CoA C-acetyltransferase n=1 Tax=Streptomyces jeddahensis TaxID=1716141 RepID=A0A177HUB3_9ACTN|nr:3-oxoadipyl-CoA/3-oxo-5,6-dehydrosuberyl-CoA thiolase [Streptomyces jeddahensis]